MHQTPRPVTPTIRSSDVGEGWSPISTPEHSTPRGTPRGTPARGPSVGSSPKTPVRGIPVDVYGGIPVDQSGLVQTYMMQTPIHDIQAEEERDEVPIVAVIATTLHWMASAETIILDPEGEAAQGEVMMVQEDIETTEAETSAKESTGGSPRVPKQRKRKTSSERAAMTVSSETIELEGKPVFKARRKDILKSKDIGNQARRGRSKTRESRPSAAAGSNKALEGGETIEETLGEVFAEPLTHKTSLYKQFWEEQKNLRNDALNPNYGGKGIGQGGRKRKSTTTTKKVPGSIPMEGW